MANSRRPPSRETQLIRRQTPGTKHSAECFRRTSISKGYSGRESALAQRIGKQRRATYRQIADWYQRRGNSYREESCDWRADFGKESRLSHRCPRRGDLDESHSSNDQGRTCSWPNGLP